MYNYRCTRTKCRARTTLKKKKEAYVFPERKVCPKCGCKISYDPEPKRRSKRDTCYCDGWAFPHRHKSEPWCRDSERSPTLEEYRHRHGDSAVDSASTDAPTAVAAPYDSDEVFNF